ncbi:hypothetical protein LAY57_23710 [Argonema antarcticum A004/B2]|nr:hypothetical protein [Argonema antarcticum A004/B2]
MIDNRELAPIEQAMEILNRRAGSYNVVTISRIEGFLNEEILRQVLDLIQCRHPRLNSRIVGDLDNLRFETEGTQKIPLRVENKLHNEEWQEVVLEEMNEKIDSSKVLLRSVLVPTFAGKMILNFMFSEPSLGRDTMESLVNNAILCLVETCNNKVVTLMT